MDFNRVNNDPPVGSLSDDLKTLRKRLYVYQNQLLKIEHQSKLCRGSLANLLYRRTNESGGNGTPRKRHKSENALPQVDAFSDAASPLQNEYILEMIANFLPSQDLRNCRLVCKLWAKEMERVISKRKLVIVTDPECIEAENLLKDYKEGRSIGVGTLCFFDIQPESSLYQNLLSAFGWTLSTLKLEECKLKPHDLKNVLTYLAPHLESLSVKDRIPETQTESTFAIINNLCEGKFILPLLKKLQWSEEFGKVQLQEIVKCCPNLVDLEYKHCPIPGDMKHFKTGLWDSLKTLKLSPRDELREIHLTALTALGLKLQKLTLFGIVPKSKTRMFKLHEFLKSLSSTLLELDLFQHYSLGFQTYSFCKPSTDPLVSTMTVLKVLHVDFSFIKSLKFIDKLPALQHFVCKSQAIRDWKHVLHSGSSPRKSSRTYPTLKSLDVGEICPSSLSKLATYFSSLVNLEMNAIGLDDSALRVIISGFPLLRELRVVCKSSFRDTMGLTDSGVTGIPLEVCKQILHDENFSDVDPEKLREHPHIGDLKHLYRLELGPSTIDSNLSDVSVLFSISKMKSLFILGLPNCKITDASLNAIGDHLSSLAMLELPASSNFTPACLNNFKFKHRKVVLKL